MAEAHSADLPSLPPLSWWELILFYALSLPLSLSRLPCSSFTLLSKIGEVICFTFDKVSFVISTSSYSDGHKQQAHQMTLNVAGRNALKVATYPSFGSISIMLELAHASCSSSEDYLNVSTEARSRAQVARGFNSKFN